MVGEGNSLRTLVILDDVVTGGESFKEEEKSWWLEKVVCHLGVCFPP